MIRLLWLVHLPHWRRLPLQAALPVLGIAVGVAAIVSVDLGSRSTVSSFRHTIERLEGRATHQVMPSASPVDPRLAWELVKRPEIAAAAPVLETMALAAEPLRVIGIDPFAEAGIRQLGLSDLQSDEGNEFFVPFLAQPGALVVSRPFLRRNALATGDTLSLAVGSHRRTAFVLAALPERVGDLQVPDNLALCDLATAQELTGRDDVTRIDLVVTGDVAAVRQALPPGLRLAEPGGRTARLTTMLAALRSNLGALSYLALFVSLFLIYNALLLAVLRRRPQLGVVRCLGATRREVWGAWLVEAALIGVLGTALGIGLGLLTGRFALTGFARTASDLYGYVQASTLDLAPGTFLKAAGVGLMASVLAAIVPALEAARTVPAHTAYRGEIEATARRRRALAPWLAVPLVVILVASLSWNRDQATGGYVAAICLALAMALMTPSLATGLLRSLGAGPLRRLGMVVALAAANIREAMSRTGVALAALTVALSMSIAMGTMVSSFRTELTAWIDDAVRADIYVSPATAQIDRLEAHVDPTLVQRLRDRPTVAAVDTYRGLEATVGGIETFVAGIEIDVYRARTRPVVIEGPSPAELVQRVLEGQAAVSETLMRRAKIHPGDRIVVEAGGREATFSVAGVYRDYSSDRGVVLTDRPAFEAAFGRRPPNSVALYVTDGIDVETEVDALKRELSHDYALQIRSNRSLRDEARTVFERTFSVANALEVIGIGVAAIGILSALLAILMERRRELATLRALGLTRAQLNLMLLTESLLMALLAWSFALVAGSGLAWILLRVINVRSFGWSLPFDLPWHGWLANLGWSLLAAALATLWPMLESRRLAVAAALREE
jgi:putative ABC transport system permease protein